MGDTKIQWATKVWNPILGCTRISAGCENCYAERAAFRMAALGWSRYEGLTRKVGAKIRWTGDVAFVEDVLAHPLRWTKPQRVFVNSMSDLFHADVRHEWLLKIFDVMAQAEKHTFLVLTKRPARMREFCTFMNGAELPHGDTMPLPNVHLGVSVENQETADERIQILLKTPSAVRWVSYEPALGPVDFQGAHAWACHLHHYECSPSCDGKPGVHWIVVGGESGPGARPFDLAWARETITQCRAAKVPAFVKQMGANAYDSDLTPSGRSETVRFRDSKGGDPEEWPTDLRVREFPA